MNSLIVFIHSRGAAGTGATGASAPVNFWVRQRRTRPKDKVNNGFPLRIASETIDVSYLHVCMSYF